MPRRNFANKYGAKPTIYRGRKYHSKAEAGRARELDAMLEAGEIAEWAPQPRFKLTAAEILYIADFQVCDSEGRVWVEDVKGKETPEFKLKKRLWACYGPLPLHVRHVSKRKGVEIVGPGSDNR